MHKTRMEFDYKNVIINQLYNVEYEQKQKLCHSSEKCNSSTTWFGTFFWFPKILKNLKKMQMWGYIKWNLRNNSTGLIELYFLEKVTYFDSFN